MLISGAVALFAMAGCLVLFTVAGVGLAVWDRHFDAKRRHWQPAESSTHW
jgi:hypothetical protein